MILDRRHLPWAFLVLFATAVAALFYLANFHPKLLPIPFALPPLLGPIPPVRNTVGGTPLGLIFGTLAFMIFLFASAMGARKKRRLWRIGSVQTWLRAHIWLSILTIPLILFHSGFALGGPMTSTLAAVYAIVMASGFFGLAMQQFMPRVMTESLPREVVFEQIPHIRTLLVDFAEKLKKQLDPAEKPAAKPPATAASEGAVAVIEAPLAVEDSQSVILDFLSRECLPYLKKGRGEQHRLGDQKLSDDIFRLLKLNTAEDLHGKVDEMQSWCDDRRLMDLQMRLHHWLHGWLIFHVPFSVALLVLTLWHAWIAMTYLQS